MKFKNSRRTSGSLATAALALATLLAGCAPTPLNSERIVQRFGSYGVQLVEQDENRRIASLYSEHDGLRTCRSYAIVFFESPLDPALEAADRLIRDGASIGSTFAGLGWRVNKTTLDIRTVTVESARLARLMDIHVPADLAMHAYRFVVSREGDTHPYATIVEIHHPDYLDVAELRRIYRRLPAEPATPAERAAILALVAKALAD